MNNLITYLKAHIHVLAIKGLMQVAYSYNILWFSVLVTGDSSCRVVVLRCRTEAIKSLVQKIISKKGLD